MWLKLKAGGQFAEGSIGPCKVMQLCQCQLARSLLCSSYYLHH